MRLTFANLWSFGGPFQTLLYVWAFCTPLHGVNPLPELHDEPCDYEQYQDGSLARQVQRHDIDRGS